MQVVLLALGLSAGAHGGDDGGRLYKSAAAIGPRAIAGVRALMPLLAQARSLAPAAQLRAVNDFYNQRIAFDTDAKVWGRVDYWASPLELLDKDEGDCEDYAIAKYFTLRLLGVPAASLRLVYARARLDEGVVQPHMVLAYLPQDGGEALILDNLIDAVTPASMRSDLSPVFSFNSDALWPGLEPTGGAPALVRLPAWRAVLERARAEGFP